MGIDDIDMVFDEGNDKKSSCPSNQKPANRNGRVSTPACISSSPISSKLDGRNDIGPESVAINVLDQGKNVLFDTAAFFSSQDIGDTNDVVWVCLSGHGAIPAWKVYSVS